MSVSVTLKKLQVPLPHLRINGTPVGRRRKKLSTSKSIFEEFCTSETGQIIAP